MTTGDDDSNVFIIVSFVYNFLLMLLKSTQWIKDLSTHWDVLQFDAHALGKAPKWSLSSSSALKEGQKNPTKAAKYMRTKCSA